MESFFAPILTALAIIFTYTQLTYTLVSTTVNRQLAKVACEKDGSEFLTWCNGTSSACVKKYTDAGVNCTTTSGNCQGFCIETETGLGACSEYPFPKQSYDKYLSGAPQTILGQPPAALPPQLCPSK